MFIKLFEMRFCAKSHFLSCVFSLLCIFLKSLLCYFSFSFLHFYYNSLLCYFSFSFLHFYYNSLLCYFSFSFLHFFIFYKITQKHFCVFVQNHKNAKMIKNLKFIIFVFTKFILILKKIIN